MPHKFHLYLICSKCEKKIRSKVSSDCVGLRDLSILVTRCLLSFLGGVELMLALVELVVCLLISFLVLRVYYWSWLFHSLAFLEMLHTLPLV